MTAVQMDPEAPRAAASLMRASGVLGLAAIVSRGANLGVIAALGHASGRSAIGLYGISTLTASLLALAASCGFPVYLTRLRAAGLASRRDISEVHAVRLAAVGATGAAIWAVCWMTLGPREAVGFAGFASAVLLDQWNETAWALVRGTNRAHREAIVNGSTYTLLLVVVGTLAASGILSFELGGLAALSMAAARSGLAVVVTGVDLRVRVIDAWKFVRGHVRGALPYLAADILGLAYLRGDTLVLAAFVTTASVGDYVAAASIIAPLVQVGAAMSVGAIATATRRSVTGDSASPAVATFFSRSGLALAAASCVLLTPIAYLELPSGRSGIVLLATILALFVPLRFLNFGMSSLLLAEGRATARLWIVAASAIFNVVLNVMLDPWFGAVGAALATVLTEVVVTVAFLRSLRNRALRGPSRQAFVAVVLGFTGPVLVAVGWSPGRASLVAAAACALVLCVGIARRTLTTEPQSLLVGKNRG